MAEKEEWRICVDWLVRCQIIQEDHRVTQSGATVIEFANILRDGVLICHLLNQLSPGAIDLKDFSQRPQMSQFLCLKNIRAFLNTCRKHFGVDGELFDPYDLYEVKDFGKVIKVLSLLSKTPKARASNIEGFRIAATASNDPIYSRLPDIADKQEIDEEDPYGYGNYDHVNPEADEDEIYEDLMNIQRGASAVPRASDAPRSKREYCLQELTETEKNYVDVLDMIIQHFFRPLKNCTSNEDHNIIFLCIEKLSKIHKDFYSELCHADKGTGIPDCFIRYKEKFLIYGEFCSNLPRSQAKVDELCLKSGVITEKINECQKRANEGKFRLRDLLSVPMQRVLKYHLLLTELIKQTDKEHHDRKALGKALDEMKDLSLYVNEVKRDNEALQLIFEIQNSITDLQMPDNTSLKDYGKLLKDGELKIKSHDDNKTRPRYIFLFDKVMLMCKSRGETYGYKNALILSQYRIEDTIRNGPDKAWSHQFMLVQKDNQSAYTISAKTDDMKRKWMDAIAMAHENTSPLGARDGQHDFIMHSFDEPTICDVCRKLLRGVFYQGYRCQLTKMAVHKECIAKAKDVRGPPTRPSTGPRQTSFNSGVQRPPPPVNRNMQRAVIGKVKAKSAYNGTSPDEGRYGLKFSEGEVIQLISKDDPYWWEGRLRGMEGFFPSTLVSEMPDSIRRAATFCNGSGVSGIPVLQTFPDNGGGSSSGVVGGGSGGGDRSGSPVIMFRTVPPTAAIRPIPSSKPVQRHHSLDSRSSPKLMRKRSSISPGQSPKPLRRFVPIKSPAKPTPVELAACPWYVGKMPREVASIRLENTPNGTFLIRLSVNAEKNSYALSIKFNNNVKHIRIHFMDGMYYLADCKMFRSIQELVKYYSENSLQFSFPELVTTLLIPFKDASTTAELQECVANFDYTANQLNQLSINAGDRIQIVSKAGGDKGWWKGRCHGKTGYFPSAYVTEDA